MNNITVFTSESGVIRKALRFLSQNALADPAAPGQGVVAGGGPAACSCLHAVAGGIVEGPHSALDVGLPARESFRSWMFLVCGANDLA
jgi:hypothetical protein